MALTHARIKALKAPGRYGAGFGLYLRISPGGSKQWVQRVQYGGKRRDIGLGGWPVVSLAKARERAFANRVAISDGKDPLADRRKAKAPTFRDAAAKTCLATKGRWRNDKTAKNFTQQFELHAYKLIGDLPVDKIGREQVLRVLTPIWTKRPEVARKLRSRLRAVLAWAQAHGYVDQNAAGEGIDAALPSQPAVKAHYAALPFDQVPDCLRTIEAATGASDVVRACFRYMVMTACRAGEARGARWSEIDLDAATWTIPPARMKANREHRVPLSDAALAVLREVEPLRGESDLVFPSAARQGTVEHDAHEAAAHREDRRRAARVPYIVPHVGERTHEQRPRRNGAVPCASGGKRRRTRLCAVGSVREAPPPNRLVGGVSDKR